MAKEDLEKVTIRLTQGAAQRLNDLFPSVGYNRVIRTMVDNFLKGVEEKSQRSTTRNPLPLDIDVKEMLPDG